MTQKQKHNLLPLFEEQDHTVLFDIVKDYCEDHTKEYGLFLLPAPTGFGKTYTIFEFLRSRGDALLNSKQRYIFITTQKKNLKFEEDFLPEVPEIYRNYCMQVKANWQSVYDNFDKIDPMSIPEKIHMLKEFVDLKELIENIKLENNFIKEHRYKPSYKAQVSYDEKRMNADLDKLRQEVEPAFRRVITNLLNKVYGHNEERKLHGLVHDEDWKWLKILYPATDIDNKKILFMSMDKFIYPFSTVTKGSTYLYDDAKFLKNTVIFIDEFDATKQTLLNAIITQQLNRLIDLIQLFRNIHSTFQTHTFPERMTMCRSDTSTDEEKNLRQQQLKDMLSNLQQHANELYDKYWLSYSYKIENSVDDNTSNALFQDYRVHTILDDAKKFIAAQIQHNERTAKIYFSDVLPPASHIRITQLIYNLQKLSTHFFNVIASLAYNYTLNQKNEKNEFTLDNAIASILEEFSINGEMKQIISDMILSPLNRHYGLYHNRSSINFDMSFYNQGFRCFHFNDQYSHDMKSVISMTAFNITPERILATLCTRAKVLGISATATLPSVISNYSLRYLQSTLQGHYYTLSTASYSKLKDAYHSYIKDYKNVNIHVALLGKETDVPQLCQQIMPTEEMAQMLQEEIEKHTTDEYISLRYLRIALAFKQYLMHEDIRSFLCLLNKHPKHGDIRLEYSCIESIFTLIAKSYEYNFHFESDVKFLDGGNDYVAKKDNILTLLGQGRKLFVFSTYQTVGAGQNLQYTIPKELQDLVFIDNGRPKSTKKDFDAIYLDMPTNIIPTVSMNPVDGPQDISLYNSIFLYESLYENAEISEKQKTYNIQRNYMRYLHQKRNTFNPQARIQECDSINLACTKTIIQAIGRICRTNMKSPNIYIYADYGLVDKLDYIVCDNEGLLLNPEFVALVNTIRDYATPKTNRQDYFTNYAQLVCRKSYTLIQDALKTKWDVLSMYDWEKLRETTLKWPIMDEDEYKRNIYAQPTYIEFADTTNIYYYYENEDYKNVEISLTKDKQFNKTVSEGASKLSWLMKNAYLKWYFEKNSYATTWSKGKYSMSPVIFNNIYRGALGEACGKALIEKELHVTIDTITNPDLFEKFDFVIGNNVYIDFKNWHESMYMDQSAFITKVVDKAKDCNAKCVVIANIITEGEYLIQEHIREGIKIVIIPALLTNDDIPQINTKAFDRIGGLIHEFTNQNK